MLKQPDKFWRVAVTDGGCAHFHCGDSLLIRNRGARNGPFDRLGAP
jgi:hypothetical protein